MGAWGCGGIHSDRKRILWGHTLRGSMGRFDFFMGHMAFCHGAFRFAHGADSCRQWGKLDLPISSDPFAICRIPCRTLRTCRPPRQDRHQVSVPNLKVALPFWILALPFLKMALTPFSPINAPPNQRGFAHPRGGKGYVPTKSGLIRSAPMDTRDINGRRTAYQSRQSAPHTTRNHRRSCASPHLCT